MTLKNVNTVLATVGALFIAYVGLSYVLVPESTAPGFGLPRWPPGDGDGFLVLKGIRDLVSGMAIAAMVLTGQRRALGWLLLVIACTPLGDMITVLAHDGSSAAAFGIHGATAALVALTGVLTLRETRARPAAAEPPSLALQ
ncbi:DUF4267 domain-containing protein [Amycolatopsis sp. NPDC051071]|uniref:DUF4267 domain-containing protein n=1 Tax=Amycolatopsis sp. NPDC051071 TaxID=3154637 RepID=UPI003413E60D